MMSIQYSDKLYAFICIIPPVQNVVGIVSALRNAARLIMDVAFMILWRMGPEAFNKDCDRRIKDWKGKISDPITWDTTTDPKQKKKWNDFCKKQMKEIESLKMNPAKDLKGLALGILSAIPIVGSVYNYHLYRSLSW